MLIRLELAPKPFGAFLFVPAGLIPRFIGVVQVSGAHVVSALGRAVKKLLNDILILKISF
jgi:hypothetical protein